MQIHPLQRAVVKKYINKYFPNSNLSLGSYSEDHCWTGGVQCDLVKVVKLASSPDHLSFTFHGLGQVFHLSVTPDTKIVNHYLPSNSSSVGPPFDLSLMPRNPSLPEGSECFYSGQAWCDDYSGTVSLSVCHGLVGVLCSK